jgi:hypothetical protein
MLQPDPPSRTLVSLNEIFKQSMRKAQMCHELPDVIVRNDALPDVYASSDDVLIMFDCLLGTILKTVPTGNKLFLYVDCDKEKKSVGLVEEELECFAIRFHTNLTTGDHWKALHAQPLSKAAEIISNHNWIFGVNNIFQTGCLFTITVKGKLA